MNAPTISAIVTAVALALLALGTVLVFAPGESVAVLTGRDDLPSIVASLLGGALFGLGMMNWMTRRSPLGGIYGRPVLMANLVHFVVGGLALLRVGLDGEAIGGLWALSAFYLGGAAFYGVLLFVQPEYTERAPS